MSLDRMIIGVMTGTSIDAIDASLVRVTGTGYEIDVSEEHFVSHSLDQLREELRAIANGSPATAEEFAKLSHALGEMIATLILTALGSVRADLVVLHGQTIYHKPPLTWQLINPWPVAARLRTPVMYDLRRADLASGGEGAPLTPIADAIMFAASDRSRAIVNLGGFCNATLLPATPTGPINSETISGMDICPCNHWLDRAAQHYFSGPHDPGGAHASRGTIQPSLQNIFQADWTNKKPRTSLGSQHEGLPCTDGYRGEDVLATICDVIASLIADACDGVDEILCAGGSTQNNALMDSIRAKADVPVSTTQEAGIDPLHREAIAMAVLGALSMDGIPIGLERVTGVKGPIVSGSWCFPNGIDTLRHG
ncbi:MAG: anhydro-N-acetylmuramic acid kinase [Phycisphaerales bacterium]